MEHNGKWPNPHIYIDSNNIFLSVGRVESFINGGEIPANYVEISSQIFIPQKVVPDGICSTVYFSFSFWNIWVLQWKYIKIIVDLFY